MSASPQNLPFHHAPGWVEHVMWWQVYPLGIDGRDVRAPHVSAGPGEGLSHLHPYLDHVVALGLNGLLLGPVFSSLQHGYDTLDHYAIDDRLGARADFDALVTACHARGIRVLLDGVFNHVSIHHTFAQRALAEGPEGPYAAWFDIDWNAPGGPRFADFEGHQDLVELRHETPAVREYVADVMRYWLAAGADGWRLDAAYAVDPAFWAAVLPGVREAYPDAWIVGEMIHGDYADYVARSGIDSITQYELWKATWSSLSSENFFELDWTLRRHDELLDRFVPLTFVGNHDVARIATQVGPRRAALALAVLATVGGVPSIYYGDEVGWTAAKGEGWGADDALRPALPAQPEQMAGWGGEIMRAHELLLGLRRRNSWLLRARTEVLELTNQRILYRTKAHDGEASLIVELTVAPGGDGSAEVRDPFGTVLARV